MKIYTKFKPGLAAVLLSGALLAAGCSDYSAPRTAQTDQEQTVGYSQPMTDQDQEVGEPEDVDFSDAKVARLSYGTLDSMMNQVDSTLAEAEQKASSEDAKQGVDELKDRAKDVSEELADVDEEPSAEADPDMVKKVLEVQVEADQYNQDLDL